MYKLKKKIHAPTFTEVNLLISLPIRSTSIGRHEGNSTLRLSPNVETTSPTQVIAHSLTSWKSTNMSVVEWVNIRFKVKTNPLHQNIMFTIKQQTHKILESYRVPIILTSTLGRTTRTSSPHTLNALVVPL